MATQNASDSIFGVQPSPIAGNPRLGLTPISNSIAATVTLTTAGGVGTMTAAQAISNFLRVDCQDAQSLTFPSAELLIAAIPGVTGSAQFTGACVFDLDIVNLGDTTLTMLAGTGCTLVGTATLLTVTAKRFKFVITNGAQGSAAYTVYSLGPTTM